MELREFKEEMLDECVDLYIDVFTREPWFDVYESRDIVVRFFKNHLRNNNFMGYVAIVEDEIIALSLGFTKPWIQGLEYYVDEFCVKFNKQRNGYGSLFLKAIEAENEKRGVKGMILLTERGTSAYTYYMKNGLKELQDVVVMGK